MVLAKVIRSGDVTSGVYVSSSVMEHLSKLRKTIEHRGFSLTIRHSIRYFLQKTAAPVLSKILSDSTHEKIAAAPVVGYWPQVNHPHSFNEKVIHRKLSESHVELFSTVSDKYAVRSFVADAVGEEILTDLYFVGSEPGEIPFDDLPDQFVIKATHGSGWTTVIEDKSQHDYEAVRSVCKKWLSRNYGNSSREYWYDEIDPHILIEERLQDSSGEVPPDFKFYVFDGRVEYVHVDFDRFSSDRSRRFFDRNWNPQDFTLDYPLGPTIEAPERLDKMIDIAETLGDEFEFVRVDLYHTDTAEVYFGEMTLAPGAGTERFSPVEWDFKLGECWDLGI